MKTIELEEMNVILRIPKEAIALEIRAKLLDGEDKITMVANTLTVSDIREARQAFLENLDDDYDARYELTEEGRAYLE